MLRLSFQDCLSKSDNEGDDAGSWGSLCTGDRGEAEIRITSVSEIAAEDIWVGGLIILHLMKQKDLKKKISLTLNCHIP